MKVCAVCGTEYGDDAAFCSRDRSPLRPAGAAESHDLVGQLVGERYQVERRIGEGGMGEVYLARHVLIGRACALKVMSQALSRDSAAVTRFNREATNASRISHPNVCAVYDFGLTPEGLVYLAMEYLEGRTLSAVLEASGPMPLARAAALLAQCAAGLSAAHELGIVHRDLKPDNIMVLEARDRETVKLVDFGIAKAAEGSEGQRVTKTGFVVGTPEYMSPEQLAGDPVDGRSDQYSLALVFYRLITGRLPFGGTSIQETMVKRLTDPPTPLAVARPDVRFPAGLQPILDRALARFPAERYPSVLDFSDAVAAVAASDGVATRRIAAVQGDAIPTTRETASPRARTGRKVAIGAATLVVMAGGAYGVVALTRPSGPQRGVDSAGVSPAAAPPADSGAKPGVTPAVPSAAPAPAPAPGPLSQVAGKPADAPAIALEDTVTLDETALDEPATRLREITRATRQIQSHRLPFPRLAAAAALLAQVQLEAKNKDSALALFRRAYSLDPKERYRSMIRTITDSIR